MGKKDILVVWGGGRSCARAFLAADLGSGHRGAFHAARAFTTNDPLTVGAYDRREAVHRIFRKFSNIVVLERGATGVNPAT